MERVSRFAKHESDRFALNQNKITVPWTSLLNDLHTKTEISKKINKFYCHIEHRFLYPQRVWKCSVQF